MSTALNFKHAFITAIALLGIVLSGCSIKQTVRPVAALATNTEICIIANDLVRPSFLDAYRYALKPKGFSTRALDEGSPLDACEVTSTYTANWTWDLATYMRYAELKIYRNAAPAGEAVYDASAAGMRTDKFINAENKVQELVDQLFP